LGCGDHKFIAAEVLYPVLTLFMQDIPHLEDLLSLWLELTDVRNDINHAGMREKPGKPEEMQTRIQGCVKSINSLPIGLSGASE
jgi:hypothetical protein